jgi:tetrahydromethanopterin S-methyltransferase subunit A
LGGKFYLPIKKNKTALLSCDFSLNGFHVKEKYGLHDGKQQGILVTFTTNMSFLLIPLL